MNTYHIGLDFGTYQSKACVYDLQNETHEFFRFESNNTFFLPSRVGKKMDGTLEYGSTLSGLSVEDYHYFKIAAAEDEEFIAETFDQKVPSSSKFCSYAEFNTYSPEFLSLVYLTYILFTIKEGFQKRNKKINIGRRLLKSLLPTQLENKEDLRFTIQIGIPTEWSQQKNIKRKRKFENILMAAELLQKKYGSLDEFLRASATILIEDVKDIFQSYQFENIDQFNSRLNELGISVYPETAAGLVFITKTKQLTPGYYSIMDIGGGSTDISFFFLNTKGKIRYLASESYLMAANNVYAHLAKETNSVIAIHNSQEEVSTLIKNDLWKQNAEVVSAIRIVKENLHKICYKLFNKRVYWFHKGKMLEQFNHQPIILYGGGARLPLINEGNILIHDNGSLSINASCTHIQKQNIDSYTALINILPNDDSWKSDFGLLVVALGLSFIKTDSSAVWFDDRDYNPIDGDLVNSAPQINQEEYYLYDVVNSKWSVEELDPRMNADRVKQPCQCDGRNEDCSWCGGSGFIYIKRINPNSIRPVTNKSNSSVANENKKSDTRQKTLREKIEEESKNFKAIYKQLIQHMEETPASSDHVRTIRKIAFDLRELEKGIKESNLFSCFFNTHDVDFRNFIERFVNLRRIYDKKFRSLSACNDEANLKGILFIEDIPKRHFGRSKKNKKPRNFKGGRK